MTVTLEMLRQVVIDEARKVVGRVATERSWMVIGDDDICLAVRALERHEARIAELDRRLDEENRKAARR